MKRFRDVFLDEKGKFRPKDAYKFFAGLKNAHTTMRGKLGIKFIHPNLPRAGVDVPYDPVDKCFVATRDIECPMDFFVAAAQHLTVPNVLAKELETGETVYEYILRKPLELEDDLDNIMESLEASGYEMDAKLFSVDYLLDSIHSIQSATLQMEYKSVPPDKFVPCDWPQVYFPVGNGEYHLLSILYPSSVHFALHDRLGKIQNDFYEEAWEDVSPDTRILGFMRFRTSLANFGGDNQQNISVQNNIRKNCRVLLSFPPMRGRRDTRSLSSGSFFLGLSGTRFSNLLMKLHVTMEHFGRHAIREVFDELMESIMQRVLSFRMNPVGWSDDVKRLPKYQAVWLDEKYVEQRDREWMEKLSLEIARWILTSRLVPLAQRRKSGNTQLELLQRIALRFIERSE